MSNINASEFQDYVISDSIVYGIWEDRICAFEKDSLEFGDNLENKIPIFCWRHNDLKKFPIEKIKKFLLTNEIQQVSLENELGKARFNFVIHKTESLYVLYRRSIFPEFQIGWRNIQTETYINFPLIISIVCLVWIIFGTFFAKKLALSLIIAWPLLGASLFSFFDFVPQRQMTFIGLFVGFAIFVVCFRLDAFCGKETKV